MLRLRGNPVVRAVRRLLKRQLRALDLRLSLIVLVRLVLMLLGARPPGAVAWSRRMQEIVNLDNEALRFHNGAVVMFNPVRR